jgi:hypothetical protein
VFGCRAAMVDETIGMRNITTPSGADDFGYMLRALKGNVAVIDGAKVSPSSNLTAQWEVTESSVEFIDRGRDLPRFFTAWAPHHPNRVCCNRLPEPLTEAGSGKRCPIC